MTTVVFTFSVVATAVVFAFTVTFAASAFSYGESLNSLDSSGKSGYVNAHGGENLSLLSENAFKVTSNVLSLSYIFALEFGKHGGKVGNSLGGGGSVVSLDSSIEGAHGATFVAAFFGSYGGVGYFFGVFVAIASCESHSSCAKCEIENFFHLLCNKLVIKCFLLYLRRFPSSFEFAKIRIFYK